MIAAKNIYALESIDRLRLIRTENVGPQTFKRLLALFDSATEAIARLPELSAKGGLGRNINVCEALTAEEELEKLHTFGASLIFWDDITYPDNLREIEDYPPVLTVLGNIELLKAEKIVGIVGSRNASANGCHLARDIAAKLSERGIIIVSGLARGIDSCAHVGSLNGGTIGVIANGVDVVYPEQNKALYADMAKTGAIVTEYPFGSGPISSHFPKRNRIISGLSKAIVVIEASQKSGSLITATYASKQKRKVFAVPGSPMDSKYSGSNWLIKTSKASLLSSEQDVLDYLVIQGEAPLSDQPQLFHANFERKPSDAELNKFRTVLHNALGFAPTSVEDIIINTTIPYHALNILLLELEVAGRIERSYGNKITRIA